MKTNIGLVQYAKGQLGKPYWMGTFGQVATEWLYTYNKSRLPSYYTDTDFQSQYGQKVHDCIGLIKGYLWSDDPDAVPRYNPAQDVDADGMQELCTESGGIDSLPEMPGVLVFAPNHVGVYIGGGRVVEARGHKWGVVETSLRERTWQTWGKCPWIEYSDTIAGDTAEASPRPTTEESPKAGEDINVPTTGTVMLTPLPLLKKGSKGSAVWAMQTLLTDRGYSSEGVDGDFGSNTEKALERFQIATGLEADGECGKMTWQKLINGGG